MLCTVNLLTAQSFGGRKQKAETYDVKLGALLANRDVSGMKEYLQQNPPAINAASAQENYAGAGGTVVRNVPLLYDAVTRTLASKCPVEMCKVILNAGGDFNAGYNGKTSVYLVLDHIATHPKTECNAAEELLQAIAARSDFDVKHRYQALLPPLSYLIRENRAFLGKFNEKYISDSVLKLLLDKGSSINTYDNEGNSLMSFAIETGNQFLSAYFIREGIDLGKKNIAGQDAMFSAIQNGQVEAIKQILNTGYVLTVHTIKNDPAAYRKFPDTYNFLTERFAGQATGYDDVIKFIESFGDRIDMVKDKLYAEIDRLNEPVSSKIEKLMKYGNCFSRKKIALYYFDKKGYSLFLQEVNSVPILVKHFAEIKETSWQAYMQAQYNKGVAVWKELVADFPEREGEIISFARRWVCQSGGYYYLKWSVDIKSSISDLQNCINSNNEYINAAVPDGEGQRLARQYNNTAQNAKDKYSSDLPGAESYESSLKAVIRQISEAVEETAITPEYEITDVEEKGDYEEIDVDVYIFAWGGSFNFTFEHSKKEGTYYTEFLFTRSHEEKSLRDFILWCVKEYRFVSLWDFNLEDVKRLERAEKVVEQFKKYGMEKWYYIEY
jgi:hypothetical protein